MRLLTAFNPNLDQANRGNGESRGRYLAVTGDWPSYYDPFASQTCINPPELSHSQPSAKLSVQAIVWDMASKYDFRGDRTAHHVSV